MAQRILALSGWGQTFDALRGIAPDATHFDYADYENATDAISAIASQMKAHDAVIGWSLGGQLAVRAIVAGLARPEKLALIATPYQFVESASLGIGMKRDAYIKFCENYAKNPLRTLNKAWELVVMGDSEEARIKQEMAQFGKAKALAKNWLKWLYSLDNFTCEGLGFSGFPSTLLVHGEDDVVVTPNQSEYFARAIPQAKLVSWKNCGHAPHWHNRDRLKQLIVEHVRV